VGRRTHPLAASEEKGKRKRRGRITGIPFKIAARSREVEEKGHYDLDLINVIANRGGGERGGKKGGTCP